MTFIVLIIVAVSKFPEGAWLPVVVIPLVITAFLAVRRHYDRSTTAIAITPDQVRPGIPEPHRRRAGSRVHRGVVEALEYARSLRPQHLAALYVSYEDDDRIAMESQWEEFELDVPLEMVHSPYRELVDAVLPTSTSSTPGGTTTASP